MQGNRDYVDVRPSLLVLKKSDELPMFELGETGVLDVDMSIEKESLVSDIDGNEMKQFTIKVINAKKANLKATRRL